MTVVRALRTGLIVLLLILLAGAVVVIGLSERQLRRRYAVEQSAECHAEDGGGTVIRTWGQSGSSPDRT